MVKKLMIAVALVASLAACRDANRNAAAEADVPAAATAAQAVAAEPAAAPGVPVTALKAPLAGGVQTLPFKYHVAVDHEVVAKKTGKASREVGIEFLEATVPEIDSRLAAEFEKVGYTREPGQAQGKAIRSLYRKSGSPDVLVWVRPGAPKGDAFKLQQADAHGTIYLAWATDKQ